MGFPFSSGTIDAVIETEFADQKFEYGKDYVNLGYNPGARWRSSSWGPICARCFRCDVNEDDLDDIPMTANISNLQDMELIIDISTGNPGTKEWVQYAASPPRQLKLVVGSTAVQAPQAYPYHSQSDAGIAGGDQRGGRIRSGTGSKISEVSRPEVQRRHPSHGPQFWGHLLIIGLILLGNGIYFAERLPEGRR